MSTTTGLLTEAEIEAVRRPYRAARLLPGRAYQDPAFYAFARARIAAATTCRSVALTLSSTTLIRDS